jgi:TadE-like protein
VLRRFRREHSRASRGQAIVEFAIILPLMMLLLVLSLDFGRVFFGWVGLHNASRIAANEAARHPKAWDGNADALDATQQARYYELVERDLEALNCDVDMDGDGDLADDLPEPLFTNRSQTADPYELGDLVQVDLTCDFEFITPLGGMLLGNPFTIGAGSHFHVLGEINGIPVGGGPPPSGCLDNELPTMVGVTVAVARDAWIDAGFLSVNFSPDTSAGRDDETVTAVDTTPEPSAGNCLVATASVVVTSEPAEVCTSPEIPVPNFIGMTVDDARSTWEDDFTGPFSPASGFDTEIVESQNLTGCAEPDESITVTHGPAEPPPPPMCDMPQLVNQKVSAARTAWTTEGFSSANFTALPPSHGGNTDYKIGWQSLVGGQEYLCTASVTVAQEPQP